MDEVKAIVLVFVIGWILNFLTIVFDTTVFTKMYKRDKLLMFLVPYFAVAIFVEGKKKR